MRIPLHISPSDRSEAAKAARFDHAIEAAQFNPKGFRQPGRHGTSLVVEMGIRAGQMDNKPEISKRGREKRERRAQHVANVLAQQAAERAEREERNKLIARALGLHHHSEAERVPA